MIFQLKRISVTLLALIFSGSALAQSDVTPIFKVTDDWRFSVTPYVWVPGLMATLSNNNGPVTTVDFSMNQIVSNLKSGVMGATEIRKGNWGLSGDFFNATLQNQGAFNTTDSTGTARIADLVTLKATMFTGSVLYTVINTKDLNMDALVGARAVFATASVNLNDRVDSLNAATTFNTITPIAGFKGRYRIADSSWYVPYYADAGSGGGTTTLTWQAILGVGKAINNWIDVSLTYRALEADLHGNGSVMKANLKGPQLAMTFNF